MNPKPERPQSDQGATNLQPQRWSWLSRYRWPLLILVAHLPLLLVHFTNLWIRPQYQHFPLIIIAFVGLFASRITPRSPLDTRTDQSSHWPIVLLWIVSLCCLVLGTVLFSPWFAALGFVIALAGCMLAFNREFHIESAIGLWLICVLLVPVPGNYQARLSQSLQQSTTQTSGVILNGLGVPNLVDGTTLSLASGKLFVEEACSGIVSMMSILATCLVLAVIRKRGVLHLVFLVCSGLLWAAAMNIVRITAIAVFRERFQIDLSEGWEHTALGLVVYCGSLGLIVSTDHFMHFLFAPGRHADGVNPVIDSPFVVAWLRLTGFGGVTAPLETPTSSLSPAKNELSAPLLSHVTSRSTVMLSLVFCLVGLSGFGRAIARFSSNTIGMASWKSPLVQNMAAESMPETVGPWTRKGFDKTRKQRLFAQQSRLWQYQMPSADAIFSIDFAFPQWHDLCQCYEAVGWKKNSISDYRDVGNATYVATNFRKNERANGQLYFCLCDTNGQVFPPPETTSVLNQLHQRTQNDQTLLQIQLWVTRDRKATDRERDQDEVLFTQLRDRLLEMIATTERSAK